MMLNFYVNLRGYFYLIFHNDMVGNCLETSNGYYY